MNADTSLLKIADLTDSELTSLKASLYRNKRRPSKADNFLPYSAGREKQELNAQHLKANYVFVLKCASLLCQYQDAYPFAEHVLQSTDPAFALNIAMVSDCLNPKSFKNSDLMDFFDELGARLEGVGYVN